MRTENPNDERNSQVLAWRTRIAADETGVRAPFPYWEMPGIAQALHRVFTEAWAACGAFEWVALGYLGLSSGLILFFWENLAHPAKLLGMQVFVASVILGLCGMEARWRCRVEIGDQKCSTWNNSRYGRNPGRWDCFTWNNLPFWGNPQRRECFTWNILYFWRHWYPHLFFLFCFEELAYLVHLVYRGWFDAKLIAFDAWLTGVNPSLWLERLAHPALNEFMQFAYFTYFVYLLILGGILYYRREMESYWAVMTYSAVGYALGYMISIFFPVQSPWFTFAGMWRGDLVGGPFTALINFIEKCGRVHGAAFPSQHVAGAMAALWGAWRHRRWLFWTFLPFVVCMCVSTVYVRNHYVADVFGGLITGTLGYFLGKWIVALQRRPAIDAEKARDGVRDIEQLQLARVLTDELQANRQA